MQNLGSSPLLQFLLKAVIFQNFLPTSSFVRFYCLLNTLNFKFLKAKLSKVLRFMATTHCLYSERALKNQTTIFLSTVGKKFLSMLHTW